MGWNWQQPGWPDFAWHPARLARAEEQFLLGAGVFLGTAKHLGAEVHDRLIVEVLSNEALTTSEIEGEILNRDSVQASIRRQLGFPADDRRVSPAERGIAEMMVDLYRNFSAPLDDLTLFAWQRMLFSGRSDRRDIGRYRTHSEPMQIVSGRVDDPKVHFEAPPSTQVVAEMARFIDWFNRTAPTGTAALPALTRAGTAHLYFESIHPFEDGNGRVGRAIAEKALAQSLGGPFLTALAATLLTKRRSYYEALEAANKHIEITDWLAWFAGTSIEAQRRTIAEVEFLIDKTQLLDRLRGHLNARQEAVVLRMLREGPRGFEGGLSASNYIRIAKTSASTATRDLTELVAQGALRRTGNLRHTRYHLTIPLRRVPLVRIGPAGDLISDDKS